MYKAYHFVQYTSRLTTPHAFIYTTNTRICTQQWHYKSLPVDWLRATHRTEWWCFCAMIVFARLPKSSSVFFALQCRTANNNNVIRFMDEGMLYAESIYTRYVQYDDIFIILHFNVLIPVYEFIIALKIFPGIWSGMECNWNRIFNVCLCVSLEFMVLPI